MTARKKAAGHAGNAAGRKVGSFGDGTSPKPAIGRPPIQVNGNARRPSQRAPRWREPAGAKGLRMLALLWGSPTIQRRRGRQ
jgi:hypothetical protein